jgi:hypothetical protein
MLTQIRKFDEVWTTDNHLLGLAYHIQRRTGEVNPDLQFFAAYLIVKNLEIGDDYFVPVNYISHYDPDNGRVQLSVSFRTVMERTWTRLPQFVLAGHNQREELVETPQSVG